MNCWKNSAHTECWKRSNGDRTWIALHGRPRRQPHRQEIAEPPSNFFQIFNNPPWLSLPSRNSETSCNGCLPSGRAIRPLLMREPHFDASRLPTALLFLTWGRHIYFCNEGGMMFPYETSDFGDAGNKVFRQFLMAGLSDDDKETDASPHAGFLFVWPVADALVS